jgi:hypothetical protein
MKAYRYPRVYWLVIGLIFLLILYGCKTTTPKEEAPPEAPSKPSEPAPPPKKPFPPKPSPPSKEVAPLPAEKSGPGETYFTHTIKWSGETLWIIALWYTGDRNNWRGISEAMIRVNPNANIHVIHIGDKIPVPKSLMKTQELMPREFVESFYSKPKEKEPPTPPTPKEPELFGPKEGPKKE